jgi:hypothetical protein
MLGTARADESEFDFQQGGGWGIEEWTLQTSLYTTHFDPEPYHVDDQNLVGIEAHLASDWLAGVALFDNSFGQSSQLVYAGKTWPMLDSQHWYAKLTGGLLHGYKEPYEDKIPLNGLGVAPVVIPALGFRYGYFVAEANLGGLAVVMLTAGLRF